MIRHWLRIGASKVVWVDPYPTRFPRFADFRRKESVSVTASWDKRITVIKPISLPFEPVSVGRYLNKRCYWPSVQNEISKKLGADNIILGIGKPSHLALNMMEVYKSSTSFYDAMDDFPAFYDGWAAECMHRHEVDIAARVAHIFVSSSTLFHKFHALGHKKKIHRVLNAYDMGRMPEYALHSRKPVIGYVGSIAKWFDWPLAISIARALPHVEIRLVGPQFSSPEEDLPENIKLYRECSSQEAIRHVSEFLVGLIPFKVDRLTDSIDPIKYYEYRAAGLTVWSTSFGEMSKRSGAPGVELVSWESPWLDLLNRAHLSPNEQVAQFRASHDWSERFCSLSDIMISHDDY